MDLVFNELSIQNRFSSKENSHKKVYELLSTCKAAQKYGFQKLRFAEDSTTLLLAENYTINDWLNDPATNNIHRALFLGLHRKPYIGNNDDIAIEKY